MRVTFVLPGSSRFPVGGYKVVYEYANHLSQRGHTVTVVHPALLDRMVPWHGKIYHAGRYLLWGVTRKFGPQHWFRVSPAVRLRWVPSLNESYIPVADAIIATGWPTAEIVATYSSQKGRKYYLLQHYETWWGPEQRVRATWRLPLHKIVIARWLAEIAHNLGETGAYIPNGLDFQAFGCDVPVIERKEPSVAMLYHSFEWKGSADGFQALELAREMLPGIRATLFGVSQPRVRFPSWVTYVRNPRQAELRQIYNKAKVFLAPSWAEGWPLPPAEAMMCGAALVCTNIGGHREYAIHERNSLMAEPKKPQALAAALVRVLTDESLRQSLAERALSDISRFTWSTAVDRFESELLQPTRSSDLIASR